MYIIHVDAIPVLGSYHCAAQCHNAGDHGPQTRDYSVNAHWSLPASWPADLHPVDHLAIVAESLMDQCQMLMDEQYRLRQLDGGKAAHLPPTGSSGLAWT